MLKKSLEAARANSLRLLDWPLKLSLTAAQLYRSEEAADPNKIVCELFDEAEAAIQRWDEACPPEVMDFIREANVPLPGFFDGMCSTAHEAGRRVALLAFSVLNPMQIRSLYGEGYSPTAAADALRENPIHYDHERIEAGIQSEYAGAVARLNAREPLPGNWSLPMSLEQMRKRLDFDSIDKLKTFGKSHHLKKAGGRQSWMICLDSLPDNMQKKLSDSKR